MTKISDEEFVEKIRRELRGSRKIRISIFGLQLLALGMLLLFYGGIFENSRSMLHRQDLDAAVAAGFGLGLLLASILVFLLHSVLFSLLILLGRFSVYRSMDLMVKFHDERDAPSSRP